MNLDNQRPSLGQPPPDEPDDTSGVPSEGPTLSAIRLLFDRAPHFVGLVGRDGAVRYANPFACALVGRDEGSLLGSLVQDAPFWNHSQEQREALASALLIAAEGKECGRATMLVALEGTLHAIDCSLRPIRLAHEDADSILVEGWDIGREIQAEDDKHRAERLLEGVIEQSPVSMALVSADGVLKHLNQAAVELFGTSRSEIVKGRPLHETIALQDWQELSMDGTPLSSDERPMARIMQGEVVPKTEAQLRRADGAIRQVLVQGAPVYQSDGSLLAGVTSFWDITEESAASQRLMRLANEQRVILLAIKLGICLVKDRLVQWVNPQFEQMFGCAAADILGKDTRRFYDEEGDYRLIGTEGYAQIMLGHEYSLEARMRRADGTGFWCRISGQAVESGNAAQGFIWILQDVTERRRWEEALVRSERLLSAVVSASPEIIIVSRMNDGRFIQVNEAFTRLTGFTTQEAIGRRSLEIGIWPSAEARAQLLQHANERGEMRNCEAQLLHKDGHVLDVLISGAAFTMEEERLLVWVIADIGDYKRARQAVHDTEARYCRLAEESTDVIAVTDASGNVLSLVGPVEPMLGFAANELLGASMKALLHPDDRGHVKVALGEVSRLAGRTRRTEFRLRNRLGEHVVLEGVCRNLIDEPTIGGIVWNIRDITERKQQELERAHLQEQLAHAMRMEAVGRLAGGVAHDFNNLLTVISGSVELAREGLDATSSLGQALNDIAQAATSAASLTRQLLAFSRRQMIEPKNVDLNELVGDLQKMLNRLVGENVSIVTRLSEDLGTVHVDPSQFEQVVVNLSVNARDAMPKGGRLTLETSNVELDETYARAHEGVEPGRYVMLAVSDTGSGITAEVKRRLFEPFFTTKARGRGVGLGLAMIFGAVKQAHGAIEVYSEVGLGSIFKIYLPRVDAPADGLLSEPTVLDLARSGETVLIVEDDASVRGVAEAMVSRLGYTVLAAENGPTALRLAREYKGPISVLMTDIVMPGMNGRELADAFRETRPETRVVYTSGYTEDVIVLHGLEGETIRFLGKPYTLSVLAAKLRQVLDTTPVALPST